MQKRRFLLHALLLTASSILLRASSMGYRTYLSTKIGTDGMGLYQLVLSVFLLAVTVSTSGVSLAVTRIVSKILAADCPAQVKSAVRKCIVLALLFSLAALILLFCASNAIATYLLGDARVALSLRLLAVGLPAMACSSCLKGYFLALRGATKSACTELFEQFATISAVVALFTFAAPSGLTYACAAVMLGSTFGELCSCALSFFFFALQKPRGALVPYPMSAACKDMSHIALPIMVGSLLRSGLATAEQLLIPRGLQRYGASVSTALSQYGILHGMTLPLLLFPAAFLTAFASLLVPEVARAHALQHRRTIRRTAARALRLTLLFSFLAAACCFAFSQPLCTLLYQNSQAGVLLRFLSPLLPLMYLDAVVDALLKGLDEQTFSVHCNFADASMRTLLVWLLLPYTGLPGYLCILFFSVIFNAALSLHRLCKVTRLSLPLGKLVVRPILCSACAVLPGTLLLPFATSWPAWISLCAALLLSCLLYAVLLRITGACTKHDLSYFKSLLRPSLNS